jgi:hypothetical protein
VETELRAYFPRSVRLAVVVALAAQASRQIIVDLLAALAAAWLLVASLSALAIRRQCRLLRAIMAAVLRAAHLITMVAVVVEHLRLAGHRLELLGIQRRAPAAPEHHPPYPLPQ